MFTHEKSEIKDDYALVGVFCFFFGAADKAVYLSSVKNTSADALSRGKTPMWLRRRGVRKKIEFKKLFALLNNPMAIWEKLVNPFKVHESASLASVN